MAEGDGVAFVIDDVHVAPLFRKGGVGLDVDIAEVKIGRDVFGDLNVAAAGEYQADGIVHVDAAGDVVADGVGIAQRGPVAFVRIAQRPPLRLFEIPEHIG